MPKKQPKHIKDLVPDPHNRRKHTPRNVGMIADGLQKVGAARSIVIDENNEILAGNATVEAAAEAGITKVTVVEASGNEVVAVRRGGLTDEQKRDLAIYDNRTGELAEWNVQQLLEDVKSGVDLSAFFQTDELNSMLDGIEEVDLDKFFEQNTNGEAEAMVNLVLKFTETEYAEAMKALAASKGTPEQVILKLLQGQ